MLNLKLNVFISIVKNMLFVKSNKNYHLQAIFFYYVHLNFNYIYKGSLFCYFAPGLKNVRTGPGFMGNGFLGSHHRTPHVFLHFLDFHR